ncbi:MAG: hypothetical protein MJY71_07965 [Bacteroidaceae bacterium]|nr:hypothetical protein [Bacteroidaceae bacterium]
MKQQIIKTKKSRDYTLNVEIFNSAAELERVNKSRKLRPDTYCYDTSESDVECRSDWYGVSSKEEAYKLLHDGWSEKLHEMRTLANKVKTNGSGKRITFQNNVTGFAPVVPLAIMNLPNSMIDTRMKPIKSKVVRIIYNIGCNACTSSDTILKNGMNVIEAVINLENSGYRCEILAMQAYAGGCSPYNSADVLMLKIKDANQPMDLKRVMFPLIHPAMFRVVGFDWQDTCPIGKSRSAKGRPLSREVSNVDELIKEAFGEDYYYFDGQQMCGKSASHIENILKGA